MVDPASLTQFLSTCLPFLMKADEDKADSLLDSEQREKCQQIWTILKPKVEVFSSLKEAINDLAQEPTNKDYHAALRVQIKKLLAQESDLDIILNQILHREVSPQEADQEQEAEDYSESVSEQGSELPQNSGEALSLPDDLQSQKHQIEIRHKEEEHALQLQHLELEIEKKQLQLARIRDEDQIELSFKRRAYEQMLGEQVSARYAKIIMGFSAFGLGAYLTITGNLFGAFPLAAGFASAGIPLGQPIELIRVLTGGRPSSKDQEDNDES